MARTHEQFVEEVKRRNNNNPDFQIKIKRGSHYESMDKEMLFSCCNGHPDFSTKPRYIIQKGSGCPLCRSAKIRQTNNTGLEQFIQQLAKVNSSVHLFPRGQKYVNTNTKMSFRCVCGFSFETLPKVLLAGHSCPKCARRTSKDDDLYSKFFASKTDVEEFNQLAANIQHVTVELIPLKAPYDKYLYSNRLKAAPKPTIFVFEDEWLTNKALITSKLNHYGQCNASPLIHARKCDIRRITAAEKRALLEANHVQGNDICAISYGAFYEDTLVAVMTFSEPRVAMGAKSKDRTVYEGIWELSRFCTDVNYRIPGIASRLLSQFKREHSWKTIYSYADKRWSVGNMYYQMGFSLVSDNAPSYFYVVDGKRKHRWNYRKDVLKTLFVNYDTELTEHENMAANGYWHVWDCGTLKFEMTNNSQLDVHAA